MAVSVGLDRGVHRAFPSKWKRETVLQTGVSLNPTPHRSPEFLRGPELCYVQGDIQLRPWGRGTGGAQWGHLCKQITSLWVGSWARGGPQPAPAQVNSSFCRHDAGPEFRRLLEGWAKCHVGKVVEGKAW